MKELIKNLEQFEANFKKGIYTASEYHYVLSSLKETLNKNL